MKNRAFEQPTLRVALLALAVPGLIACGEEPSAPTTGPRLTEVHAAESEGSDLDGANELAESILAGETIVEPSLPASIERVLTTSEADYSAIVERRRLRVLVPYAHPYFFIENGETRGITVEAFREYGQFIEKAEGLEAQAIEVIYVPCELDAMLPWLEEGHGDVVSAGLTITEEREGLVAFSAPLIDGVSELLVMHDSPELNEAVLTVEDLAGRELWVTAGSSYVHHAQQISDDLVERGLEPMRILEAPGTLSTEDLLEMTHAGIVEFTVCDDYKAQLWAQVLPGLRVREDLPVNTGGALGWAVRKNNPELRASLNDFVKVAKKGTLLGNVLIKRYFDTTRFIENPVDEEGRARLKQYASWMQALAQEYGFDWLRIAAQCYQESGLDPDAESYAGALGLMQLLPSTAKDMGCEDIHDPEQNLRAGVKYLDWLRTNFFSDRELDEINQMDFILAAYNAGPGNVRKWRKEAPSRGYDPNVWRDNVEHLAHEHVGVQPIHYVNNIEKFYVAYTLGQDLLLERERFESK